MFNQTIVVSLEVPILSTAISWENAKLATVVADVDMLLNQLLLNRSNKPNRLAMNYSTLYNMKQAKQTEKAISDFLYPGEPLIESVSDREFRWFFKHKYGIVIDDKHSGIPENFVILFTDNKAVGAIQG